MDDHQSQQSDLETIVPESECGYTASLYSQSPAPFKGLQKLFHLSSEGKKEIASSPLIPIQGQPNVKEPQSDNGDSETESLSLLTHSAPATQKKRCSAFSIPYRVNHSCEVEPPGQGLSQTQPPEHGYEVVANEKERPSGETKADKEDTDVDDRLSLVSGTTYLSEPLIPLVTAPRSVNSKPTFRDTKFKSGQQCSIDSENTHHHDVPQSFKDTQIVDTIPETQMSEPLTPLTDKSEQQQRKTSKTGSIGSSASEMPSTGSWRSSHRFDFTAAGMMKPQRRETAQGAPKKYDMDTLLSKHTDAMATMSDIEMKQTRIQAKLLDKQLGEEIIDQLRSETNSLQTALHQIGRNNRVEKDTITHIIKGGSAVKFSKQNLKQQLTMLTTRQKKLLDVLNDNRQIISKLESFRNGSSLSHMSRVIPTAAVSKCDVAQVTTAVSQCGVARVTTALSQFGVAPVSTAVSQCGVARVTTAVSQCSVAEMQESEKWESAGLGRTSQTPSHNPGVLPTPSKSKQNDKTTIHLQKAGLAVTVPLPSATSSKEKPQILTTTRLPDRSHNDISKSGKTEVLSSAKPKTVILLGPGYRFAGNTTKVQALKTNAGMTMPKQIVMSENVPKETEHRAHSVVGQQTVPPQSGKDLQSTSYEQSVLKVKPPTGKFFKPVSKAASFPKPLYRFQGFPKRPLAPSMTSDDSSVVSRKRPRCFKVGLQNPVEGVKKKKKKKRDSKLKQLVDQGILKPGKDLLSIVTETNTFHASLNEDGKIQSSGGETFQTPMSWCMAAVGTLQNTKMAYKKVLFNRKPLESYLDGLKVASPPPPCNQKHPQPIHDMEQGQVEGRRISPTVSTSPEAKTENPLSYHQRKSSTAEPKSTSTFNVMDMLASCKIQLIDDAELIPGSELPADIWETETINKTWKCDFIDVW